MTRLRTLGVFASVGALLAACHAHDTNPNAIQPPPAVPAVARQVSGVVLDAASGAAITTAVQVNVLGADRKPSPYAQDAAGHAVSAFRVRGGIASFQVDKNAPLPVELVIVTRVEGYHSGSARVTVPANGTFTFTTRLANIASPPPGVVATSQPAGSADATGTIASAIDIGTPGEATTGATVRVSVHPGTKITSASGTPLSGELTATASYYSPAADTSLASFPGGLDVAIVGTGAGSFQSAGFAAVQITDANGDVAASFSQPFGLTVTVPAGTINPETGNPVRAGDLIPFWSYDEATGQWRSEGGVTLGAESNGVLPGVAQVDHLSYFNLDWFSAACANSKTIAISDNRRSLALTLTFRARDGGYFREIYVPGGTSSVPLKNAPSFPVDVVASAAGMEVGRIPAAALCGTTNLGLPVTLPMVSPATLGVSVLRACKEDPSVTAPVGSATIFVQRDALIATTSSSGTTLFSGLVGGETVTIYGYLLDGTTLPPLQRKLVDGPNEVQLVESVSCSLFGPTGLTGGSGI